MYARSTDRGRNGSVASRIQGGKSYEEFEQLVKPLAGCP
jgi:hypothetical protein